MSKRAPSQYNLFVKKYFSQHKGAKLQDAAAAWRKYKSHDTDTFSAKRPKEKIIKIDDKKFMKKYNKKLEKKEKKRAMKDIELFEGRWKKNQLQGAPKTNVVGKKIIAPAYDDQPMIYPTPYGYDHQPMIYPSHALTGAIRTGVQGTPILAKPTYAKFDYKTPSKKYSGSKTAKPKPKKKRAPKSLDSLMDEVNRDYYSNLAKSKQAPKPPPKLKSKKKQPPKPPPKLKSMALDSLMDAVNRQFYNDHPKR